MFELIKKSDRFFPATRELGDRLKTAELEDPYNVLHLIDLSKILGYPSMLMADIFFFNWIHVANLALKSLESEPAFSNELPPIARDTAKPPRSVAKKRGFNL